MTGWLNVHQLLTFKWRTLLPLACGLLVLSCTLPEQAPENPPEMIVTRQLTPFYTTSPMQTRGPDASLPQDERVRLLSRDFGFSLVQLPDGRKGYVPSDNLAPAPPPAPKPKKREGAPSRAFDSLPEIVDDAPLPDFGLPPIEIPDPILLDEEAPTPQKKNLPPKKKPASQSPEASKTSAPNANPAQPEQSAPPPAPAEDEKASGASSAAEQTPVSPPEDQTGN